MEVPKIITTDRGMFVIINLNTASFIANIGNGGMPARLNIIALINHRFRFGVFSLEMFSVVIFLIGSIRPATIIQYIVK